MQKRIEKLLSEVAEKYSLPLEVIKEVYSSEWRFVKENINTLEFPIIQLPAWGKYVPSKKKVIKLENYYKTIREDKKKLKIKENINEENK